MALSAKTPAVSTSELVRYGEDAAVHDGIRATRNVNAAERVVRELMLRILLALTSLKGILSRLLLELLLALAKQQCSPIVGQLELGGRLFG